MNEIKKQKQLEHSYCHKLQSTNQLFKPPKTAAVLPMKQSVDAHVVGRVFPAMHLRLQMWGSESTLTKTIKLSNLASKDKRQILALLRNIGLLLNLEQNISMSQCHIYKFDWSQEDLQQVPASEPCMFWKDFSMVQRRFPTTSASSALAAFHTKQCYKKNACISFATITLNCLLQSIRCCWTVGLLDIDRASVSRSKKKHIKIRLPWAHFAIATQSLPPWWEPEHQSWP